MSLSPKYFLFDESPMHPTVGHARDVITWGLRHIKTARERGMPVGHIGGRGPGQGQRGETAENAAKILRQLLAGRPRNWPISIQLWRLVRTFGNATELTGPKAWWNAPRWVQAHEVAVHAIPAARLFGEPDPSRSNTTRFYGGAVL